MRKDNVVFPLHDMINECLWNVNKAVYTEEDTRKRKISYKGNIFMTVAVLSNQICIKYHLDCTVNSVWLWYGKIVWYKTVELTCFSSNALVNLISRR